MPEYLAPGVYAEEVSFRSPAIEGVSTTTTAFIGPTRTGPTEGPLQVLTSMSDFEQIYGDGEPLSFEGEPEMTNYMWQAANAFFAQGGQRLYAQRVFQETGGNWEPPFVTGVVAGSFIGAPAAPGTLQVKAKWPGAAGAGTVSIQLALGQNVLSQSPAGTVLVNGLVDGDVIWAQKPVNPPQAGAYYQAHLSTATGQDVWTFTPAVPSGASPPADVPLSTWTPNRDPAASDQIRVVTATVSVQPATPGALPQVWSGLPLDPAHKSYGAPDSLFAVFGSNPGSAQLATTVPVLITFPDQTPPVTHTGLDVVAALGSPAVVDATKPITAIVALPDVNNPGSDGARPTLAAYQGVTPNPDAKFGLLAFEDIDEISIVAAPGSTYQYENAGWRPEAASIMGVLIEHAQNMHYRVAVLDCGDNQNMASVQAMRGQFDSEYAAFYYPWVQVLDPVSNQEIVLPPSGFVTGIYARNDIERAVYKAPANEVVSGALGFEKVINKAQQEVLNPLGINCFRFFEGRGYRLWGARTISSNSEWKYINVRRYFAYLEHSIDKGTQWVVFEPNGPALWANVRRSISDFLFSEFQAGALMGEKPSQAYFVRCDQTTMTQNDIDNGRLICLVGVAPLYPAEFVIFRIGQWTATSNQGN